LIFIHVFPRFSPMAPNYIIVSGSDFHENTKNMIFFFHVATSTWKIRYCDPYVVPLGMPMCRVASMTRLLC